MSFRTHLESVVNQVDGSLACSVMGFDGISVDTHQNEEAVELELNGAWIEYANLLSQLRQAAEVLKTGDVQEVSINSERVPGHHQLDIRIDRTWQVGPIALSAFLDVQNVYMNSTVIQYQYSFDYSERTAFESIPILPSIGLRGVL